MCIKIKRLRQHVERNKPKTKQQIELNFHICISAFSRYSNSLPNFKSEERVERKVEAIELLISDNFIVFEIITLYLEISLVLLHVVNNYQLAIQWIIGVMYLNDSMKWMVNGGEK